MQKEISRVVSRYAGETSVSGRVDLESFEMSIRSSLHGIGRILLEKLLAQNSGYRGRTLPCEDGHGYEFIEYRDKELLTVLGPVTVSRAYYHDKDCGIGYCPKDQALDIEGTSYSPGVRRMMSRVGAYRSFGLGEEDLYELADIRVSAKEVERVSYKVGREVEAYHREEAEAALTGNVVPFKSIPRIYVSMDGTGVPVVKAETEGRAGKGEDGQGKTREAKLGCIFTQTAVDEEGRPIRDEGSTSYVGQIETAEEFGSRIYGEAKRRGIDRAQEVCVLGDGAPWIWNIAEEHFYGATQIVDLYHAREHYWKVANACFGQDGQRRHLWAEARRAQLDEGRVEDVIDAIHSLTPLSEHDREICVREVGFFEKNKDRMRYAEFKKQGMFVGSGVLEAGCRTVIGQRLKQSGMHWTVMGANKIIALRCSLLSNRWEDFWENRTCA